MATPADRYIQLIEATLKSALSRKDRSDSPSMAIEYVYRATGQAGSGPGPDRPGNLVAMRYADGAGHSRPLYRGLTLYALDRANQLDSSTLDQLALACEVGFRDFLDTASAPRSAEGALAVQNAFDAMALACSSHASAPLARSVLEAIAVRQQPDGQFLLRTASDNPEPNWYHELALLHAISTFAHRHQGTAARVATRRATEYQSEQIQPDHASSHPFALHAFLRTEQGTYLADMMLHAAGVQSPSTMDMVSLLLLADALDCMRSGNWRE